MEVALYPRHNSSREITTSKISPIAQEFIPPVFNNTGQPVKLHCTADWLRQPPYSISSNKLMPPCTAHPAVP